MPGIRAASITVLDHPCCQPHEDPPATAIPDKIHACLVQCTEPCAQIPSPFARVYLYGVSTSRAADSQQTHFWMMLFSTTGLQSHECIRVRSLLPTIVPEALPPSTVCYTVDTLLGCRVQVCQDSVDFQPLQVGPTDFPIHHPIKSPIDPFLGLSSRRESSFPFMRTGRIINTSRV
ncbi:uncharacterized protein BO95DRAFT_124066 [Aspergillus brunneoviolaceus CBS 621.78]|uniref:Uncharacterized protein n=1 Tax=Aspergillus brunneoviolaceus CBS 621.78 TaxID=1450534 RepID=A0ACD1GA98_9EURO|nr:hypothetical protein BO95DRAFT_124066 [Aspergillus brunneoviolaceus CBS 621.78]RAH46102.1 hypothetical protein BO95DRAFT_124066 [Aspergillus brunneoviolaceus CBS 621.78]